VTAPARTDRPAETLAPFLAVLSMVGSLLALVYQPVKVIPFAVLLALIAAGMGRPDDRLPLIAIVVSAVCFTVGMTIAVITKHALY
jgi:hypothetical protein